MRLSRFASQAVRRIVRDEIARREAEQAAFQGRLDGAFSRALDSATGELSAHGLRFLASLADPKSGGTA